MFKTEDDNKVYLGFWPFFVTIANPVKAEWLLLVKAR